VTLIIYCLFIGFDTVFSVRYSKIPLYWLCTLNWLWN